MQAMKAPKSLINSLKILFTILLLFIVFKSVDISKIGHDLKAFNLKSLLLILVLCWIGQLLCSERWRILAGSLQMQGSYRSFVKMYFVGMFFNIGLPSLIGGDVIKAYMLSRRSGRPLQIGLASVLQDRAAGLASLLIYGFLAILICPISWKGFPLWMAYLLSWGAIAAILWMVAAGEKLYNKFIVSHSRTFGQKILKTLAEFHRALRMSNLQSGAFLRIAVYAFANSALMLWAFRQVTVAAGCPVGIIPFAALFPLVTLVTMLPITLSGLGVRELIYVEALSLIGIPRDQGLIISLATSAMFLLCNFCGIFFLMGVPKELRSRIQNQESEVRSQKSEF
jgi:glycosyltransferase 2 family protein